jgi:5-methylcytosine-specific restriction endonuclease McrA
MPLDGSSPWAEMKKKQSRSHASFATRLQLPQAHDSRMRAMVAKSVGVITALRPEWYRARLDGRAHLRVFCGRLIVITLEGRYVWVALDERALGKESKRLRSWCWDEAHLRPEDAKGRPYPRYVRPRSRNGFYDPAKDPEGQEWRLIENAHHTYLRRVAEEGRAPDHRTRSDRALVEEIARWRTSSVEDETFGWAVSESLRLDPDARRARLALAPKRPSLRKSTQTAYRRNPDVVAEVLYRAGGRCEVCGAPAPFLRLSDGNPYLEVHHWIRLADGGEDTVENAVAACPNCHRKQHFGPPTASVQKGRSTLR